MLARSCWSTGTVIRWALVISFSICMCVLCLFLSHAFSYFQMSQSGPPKPAPATCIFIIHTVLLTEFDGKINCGYSSRGGVRKFHFGRFGEDELVF